MPVHFVDVFEAYGVFPSLLIDGILSQLREHDDAKLLTTVAKDDAARDELVRKHWHVG